jgi:AcrR family transcriptional regulator
MDRRKQILDAALACFLERGFAATSIADVRAASGASTGSIYHFFPSKEAIAVALYLDGLTGWTEATLAVPPGVHAHGGIAAIISSALDWGVENAGLMRFMDENRFLLVRIAGLEEAGAILRDARRRGETMLRDIGVDTPWEIAQPLVLGPVQAWLQLRRYGETQMELDPVKRMLGDASRRALGIARWARTGSSRSW